MKKEVDKMLNNVTVENKQLKQISNFMNSENWWEDVLYPKAMLNTLLLRMTS